MKKSILISVYDMEIGGVERSLINMLNSFDYERYEVDVLVCSHQGDLMSQIPKRAHVLPENKTYKIFRKSMVQCLKDGQLLAFFMRMMIKLLSYARAKQLKLPEGYGYIQLQLVSKYLAPFMPAISKHYDAAISYAWPHDFMMKRVSADKKVAWIHTDYSKLEIDNRVDGAMWKGFDRIISISDACTEAFSKTYPELRDKLVLIENITSPSFIHESAEEKPPELPFDKAFFHIVSVGRLSYVKGFDMAVQAMRLLRDRGFHHFKWHVIGFGGMEAELRALIQENGLQDFFILHGKKNNPYPYMKACDLFAQPSRYEGKAVSVTEAQILGKPVMITRYATAASQVTHGVDGYICELSAEGIAAGIKTLYENKKLLQKLAMNCSNQSYDNSCELEKLYEIVEKASGNAYTVKRQSLESYSKGSVR